MDIIHDFFIQNGGGENLVKSISKFSKGKIYTAFSKKKFTNIVQSKLNLILRLNPIFVFIYFNFFFKIHSKNFILFSGNYCCFSIKKCIGKKKFLYAHSLPKSLFPELYLDHTNGTLHGFIKKKIIDRYHKNLLSLDKIFFNSVKTKNKFIYAFPNLNKEVNLEVLYPYSDMDFVNMRTINKKKNNLKNLYFVINSRHQKSKNIIHLLLLLKPILSEFKEVKVYITQEGNQTEIFKNLYHNKKQIIYTGYLSFVKYRKLLLDSTAVILPSRDEDFGISALDAYNLDIPVLIQRSCGFSEILHRDYEFFYNDNNFKDIIIKLIKNKSYKTYKNKTDLKKLLLKRFECFLEYEN